MTRTPEQLEELYAAFDQAMANMEARGVRHLNLPQEREARRRHADEVAQHVDRAIAMELAHPDDPDYVIARSKMFQAYPHLAELHEALIKHHPAPAAPPEARPSVQQPSGRPKIELHLLRPTGDDEADAAAMIRSLYGDEAHTGR